MSKFFKPTPLDRSYPLAPWEKWRTDVPPQDGSVFPARIAGTSRVIAVSYDNGRYRAIRQGVLYEAVDVHQWLTWAEMGEIQQCLWKKSPN